MNSYSFLLDNVEFNDHVAKPQINFSPELSLDFFMYVSTT